MDENKLVTGQMITRDGGSAANIGKPGFRLVSFVGIIAVPDEVSTLLPPENQYTFTGKSKSEQTD